MTDRVIIQPINECYMRVQADPGVKEELSAFFTFRVPGFQFMPAYKNGSWDGYLRLYNRFTGQLYKGLEKYVERFCIDNGYELENPFDSEKIEVGDEYVESMAKEIKFPFALHWYQNDYVKICIESNRSLCLSPTSSGKSAMIYLLHRHYYDVEFERMLLIVPTAGLVHQMAGDFVEYGYDPEKIHKITAGAEKDVDAPVYISTWQSIYKMPKEWFDQFGVVVVDEAHLATAKSLVGILDKMPECKYRFGFTGTIEEESKTAKLTLEGLFGPVRKLVTTKEMIDGGQAATTKIKAVVLDHTQEVKDTYKENLKILKKKTEDNKTRMAEAYKMETDYLIGMESRNKFIRNLVWSLKDQNNLILVTRVEHGKKLAEILKREGRIVHLVTGAMSGEDREALRNEIENDPLKRHDVIGTFGVFSTGVSIKRLDNLVFAMAMKSSIKTLQAIGRLLRKGNGSDDTTVFDIADKLVTGNQENYSLGHFLQRCEIYQREKFKLKVQKLVM